MPPSGNLYLRRSQEKLPFACLPSPSAGTVTAAAIEAQLLQPSYIVGKPVALQKSSRPSGPDETAEALGLPD